MKVINNNVVRALKISYLIKKNTTGREDKSPLGRYSQRQEDNIKIYLKEITWN